MAIKPKTDTFQIRIDPELLELFRQQCADRDLVPSALIRQFIKNQSEHWAKQAPQAVSKPSPGESATQPKKTAPRAVKSTRKGVH
jgi:hypothetical protein